MALTPLDVQVRVEAWKRMIAEGRHDEEKWHVEEDAIHQDVLAAIAMGAQNPQGLAAEALKTKSLKHARWFC